MSNQCLQIGKMLAGLFDIARCTKPDIWRKEYHTVFCLMVKQWLIEFRNLEPSFERLPDGWHEMADNEHVIENATNPVLIDREISIASKAGIEHRLLSDLEFQEQQDQSDHEVVVQAGKVWVPLWKKLFPAIRGHQSKAPPDGPVGDRGWRHKGILVEGLNGRQPMEVMRELQDKPIGFAHVPDPNRLSPKKLAQLINQNCRSIGLPWNVRALQGLGIVKVKERPKKGS